MNPADLTAFARILIGMVFAFGVLPMLVLPRPPSASSTLDAYVTNLVRWFAIVIVVSHVLAGLHLYTAVSWIVVTLAIAWFARYRKSWGGFAGVLHRLWPTEAETGPATTTTTARPSLRERLAVVSLSLPVLVLLGASYWLRAKEVFATKNLSPPDAYVHMTWANAFHDNVLWPDGVYPQGLSALVALVDLLSPFTELVDVARFVGPMVGTFLVFSIYYAVVRLTRNAGAALFAAGMLGIFGANPQWREPWERQVGLLPQEFGLAVAFIAVVFAVLAVTERGGGRLLQLGAGGGIALRGHVLSLGIAAFVAAMCHPLPAAWLGLLVAVAAITATLVSRRLAALVGAGVATVVGAALGFAVVPVAQFFGVPAYLGYGAADALSDVAGNTADTQQADLLEWFGDLKWLEHNWLSVWAGIGLVVALVAVVGLVVARSTRMHGAQLLALTAVGGIAVGLYDVRPIAYAVEPFYVVRLTNLLGPTLALAFGAAVGGLSIVVARRMNYVRVTALLVVGVVALGGMATRFPADAIDRFYEREEIEWDEMTRATLALKQQFEPQTYTVVGLATQRQVLAGHGWFISAWVFARDIEQIPDDEILPVPTAETFVFVEMDPYPVREIEGGGAVEEYYFDRDKRGRIAAELYAWAERRRRVNPDTTIYYDGAHVRVYRIARNPAIRIDEDAPQFKDYTFEPGALFNRGPTSPRELEPEFDALPEPDFGDTSGDATGGAP